MTHVHTEQVEGLEGEAIDAPEPLPEVPAESSTIVESRTSAEAKRLAKRSLVHSTAIVENVEPEAGFVRTLVFSDVDGDVTSTRLKRVVHEFGNRIRRSPIPRVPRGVNEALKCHDRVTLLILAHLFVP